MINKKNKELEIHIEHITIEDEACRQHATCRVHDQCSQLQFKRTHGRPRDNIEVDDTASWFNERNSTTTTMMCSFVELERSVCCCCHVSMCLCKECERKLSYCPFCQYSKFLGMEVYIFLDVFICLLFNSETNYAQGRLRRRDKRCDRPGPKHYPSWRKELFRNSARKKTEMINRKNKELVVRIEQITMEAEAWQQSAKCSENMIAALNQSGASSRSTKR
uniref:RING-type domain-containing protein n=1 Tax=Brassica oleracea TaxID=3712 RepID=A0A3P6FNT6_BRAOL|nr:unnamed protein product [Brassica oleracea]